MLPYKVKRNILAISFTCISALTLSGCNDDTSTDVIDSKPPIQPVEDGAWSQGDLHVHTKQSDDAQVTLQEVLDLAFKKYNLDWVFLSNHLRMESRDHAGINLANGPIPFSEGMRNYEVPFIHAQLGAGNYKNKTIFSSFEWDMPTHDHINIGLAIDKAHSPEALEAVAAFEYLFTNKDAKYFSPALIEKYKDTPRAYSNHADSIAAIKWVKANYPKSYMVLNHPSRGINKYTPAQIREMNDIAPDIFFLLEGMVGNQMEPNRGGYETAEVPENLAHRTYGGTDYYVAKLGGLWDSLLAEGRHIWNVADSDYHFSIGSGKYSSGYAPGEYSKTHLWKKGDSLQDIVTALKNGRSYGTFGDLIHYLDFNVTQNANTAYMGQSLSADKNNNVTVTIKFKSPQRNNQEYPFNSGNDVNLAPVVDHIDLIVGDVVEKHAPSSAQYNSASNPTTKVLARFNSKDWKQDKDGNNVIVYSMKLEKNQYIRLRGTNLALNVAGEMKDGEPLADLKIDVENDQERFNLLNKRNYNDLWFYSNPIFLNLKK